jgi:uncharacterized protein
MKFLIWFVIILGGLTIARLFNTRQERRNTPRPTHAGSNNTANRAANRASTAAEPMVRCAHCGIYMPRSESLLIGKQTWCSEEHARLGSSAGQQS